MSISPVRFGLPARTLLGLFHPALTGAPAAPAVLLCNPFGIEALRSHRLYRILAERLAKAGSPVLRFDYYGTGDSPGDDQEGDLVGWQQDIMAANLELQRLCHGDRPTVWLGLGLGATLAALTSRGHIDGLAGLVLWEPVYDGSNYLRSLRQSHYNVLAHVRGSALRARARRQPDAAPDEVLGFALGASLRQQLLALRVTDLDQLKAPSIGFLLADVPAELKSLQSTLERRAIRTRVLTEITGIDWSTSEALGSAIAPANTLAQLIELASAA